MKTFEVELTGTTPLLHHRMTEEQLMGLLGGKKGVKKKPENPKTPREIATEHAYGDARTGYTIPMGYIIGAFKNVASDYKQKDSSRKSYKTIAGGIFRPTSEFASLTDKKNKPLKKFEVDIQKATNHLKGAVAVCRPRFDRWKTKFTVMIDDDIIEPAMALTILEDAGTRSGIGSFRVSKGGYYGQFSVTSWQEIKNKKKK